MTSTDQEVGDGVEQLPHAQWRGRLTLALCFSGFLAEGYGLQSSGVAAPLFARTLHLHAGSLIDFHNNLIWVLSSNALGLVAGAAIGGRLADKLGRKWILVLSMLLFSLFSFGSGVSDSYAVMVLMRFLAGLGLGGAMPNIIAISAETGSAKTRLQRVIFVIGALSAGGTLAGLFVFASGPGFNWRNLFVLGAVFPFFVSGLMALFLSDQYRPSSTAKVAPTTQILFGPQRALTTLCLWLTFFFTQFALYLLLNWLATLMNRAGYRPMQAAMAPLFFSLGGAIAAWSLALSLTRISRPLVLTICYLGTALSVGVLAFASHNFAGALAAAFGAGCFVVGAQALVFGMAPDYYRPDMRGTGVGWAVAIGRLGSFFGPLLPGLAGQNGVLLLLLPFICLAGAAALLLAARRGAEIV